MWFQCEEAGGLILQHSAFIWHDIYIYYTHLFNMIQYDNIYIYYINTEYTSYVYIYTQYVLMSTLKTRCSRIQRGSGWRATPRWMLTALSEREPFPWKTPSSTSGARIQGRMSTTLEKTLLGTVNKCNNIHNIYIYVYVVIMLFKCFLSHPE